MQLLHAASRTSAQFDDPNLVSRAGLVPAVRLAENVGLEGLVGEHVPVRGKGRGQRGCEGRFAGGGDGRRRELHR